MKNNSKFLTSFQIIFRFYHFFENLVSLELAEGEQVLHLPCRNCRLRHFVFCEAPERKA